MIRAKHGLLERQSLENMVLIAELEEDVSKSCELVFCNGICLAR
jgi:hypothetical protein